MNHIVAHKEEQIRQKENYWYLTGILVAVELLMSFSFLGYLHIASISVTLAYIPVLIAGCLLGPRQAALLGAVFGLASMWKASAPYVSAGDMIFSPSLSGTPLRSFLLSVGTRVLFGYLSGMLYRLAKKTRHRLAWISAVSFFGKMLHSLLVYCAMALLFPALGYGPVKTFQNFLSTENLLAILVTVAVVDICWQIWRSPRILRYQRRITVMQKLHLMESYHRFTLIAVVIFMLLSAGAVAMYFMQRIRYVFQVSDVVLTEEAYFSLFHLQIQFLLGTLSLSFLVIALLIFNRRHATYMSYEAKIDPLTGVLNRKGFHQSCEKILSARDEIQPVSGYFALMDIDHFKQINDRLGHPAGDRALQEVAALLQKHFSQIAIPARLGGDEFALFLYVPVIRRDLEEKFRSFLAELRKTDLVDGGLSCSIGVCAVSAGSTFNELYHRADQLLYTAKNTGRGRWVFEE